MKKIALAFILLLFIKFTKSQNDLNLDMQYFILGSLQEMYGHRSTDGMNHKVDSYYPDSFQLLNFIDSILKANHYHTAITYKSNVKNLYCDSMAKKINSFYTPQPIIPATDSTPELRGKEIKLKNIKFDNDIQKYSFILGIYLRFGEIKNNRSTILLDLSNKSQICLHIFQEAESNKVDYEIIESMTPVIYIYFQPDKKLQDYINKYKYLNKKL